MNNTECYSIVKDIVTTWQVWNPKDRQDLLEEELRDFDFERARDGVRDLMRNFQGIPNLSDILSSIKAVKMKEEISDCPICDNLGWVLIDTVGHGTYKKCECYNQNRHGHFEDDPNHTSEGKSVASLIEGMEAFKKGIRNERPDLSDGQIQEVIDKYFPKTSVDIF